MGTPAWAWAVFAVLVAAGISSDLFGHRGGRGQSHRAAVAWSVLWIAVGVGFVGVVWVARGSADAGDYLAAYAIEKALSLDNLFVFLIVFKTLSIPPSTQRVALTWGVLGALVFRAVFVFVGAAALERWHWLEPVFGALLLFAAWRAFKGIPKEEDENRLIAWFARHLPVHDDPKESRFAVRREGRWLVTPVLIAVLALETTDILFAIDSVPAALAITRERFVVYTSNAFAILGLRSLYVVLANTIANLAYLHFGLGAVLAFAGIKLALGERLHVHPLLSVAIVASCIGIAAWASVRAARRARARPD